MKRILVLAVASLFFASCSNTKKETESVKETQTIVDTEHTSQNSLDYQGTYKGVLPCADCDSIVVFVTLSEKDYSVTSESFKNGNSSKINNTGSYNWNSDGNTITLVGITDTPNQFRVGENKLTQLDMEGNIITGNLAQMYVLTKIE